MKTIFEAWSTVAALSAAAVLAAGCAVTPAADDEGPSGAGLSALRSPAGERVISGIAELVLTDRAWPTFEEARDNPAQLLQDGSPLYAYIRATRPLGELARPADPGGSYTFSDYPHLFLQVGDTDSLRILGTCYITLTGEEARMREVVVPLAPLTYRPGQIPADCWLSTVVSGRSGKRTYEVRLAGFAGKFESWLPVPDLLAVAPVPTDLSTGAGEYATMLRATPLRNATLLASNSTVQTASVNPAALSPVNPVNPVAVATPIRGSSLVAASSAPLPGPRQDIGSGRIELQLQSLSAALLGRRPSETYFVEGQWSSTTDQRGRTVQQHAYAAAVFKGATCSWLRLKAFRRPGGTGLVDVEQAGEPVEVNCSDLK
ncbi:MAG: hypothetical protein H0T52_01860 [Lautropia sp.]|nr:hypothetical protein [Lautropia sp.]